MYAEVYQNIFDRVSVEHEAPRRIDLPDEYQEIRLSSKGAILLMFADYLKIKTLSYACFSGQIAFSFMSTDA